MRLLLALALTAPLCMAADKSLYLQIGDPAQKTRVLGHPEYMGTYRR